MNEFLPGPVLDRLLRQSIVVTLLCLALVGLSRAFGTPADSLAGLAQCEAGPCFRGLQPGHSPWEDALKIIGGEGRIFSDSAYASIVLFSSLDGRLLDAILLTEPRDPQLSIGMVLARFGRPTCAQIYPRNDQIILHYPALHVTARFEDSRFRPHNAVISIMVGHHKASSANEGFVCHEQLSLDVPSARTIYRWQGFGPMWRYLDGGA